MNYLEVNLTECVWDMYPKNYKISLRDLKRPKCMQSHAVFVTKPVLDPLTQRAAKPLFWPRVVMKCILLQAQPRRMGSSAHAQKAQTPHSFQGRDFIDSVGRGVTGCAQFSDGLLVKYRESQSSTIQFQRVWCLHAGGQLALASSTCVSTWGHSSECFPWPLGGGAWLWLSVFFLAWLPQLRVFPAALEGRLDSDSHYFFLLDSLPLFLHFLTSLIKFALQNSGKASEAEAFLCTRGVGSGGNLCLKPPQGPAQSHGHGFQEYIVKVLMFPHIDL